MPQRDRFIHLVRLHQHEVIMGCDPLDSKEHGFTEMARWLGSKGTVLPFVGLGVFLGVFEVVRPWPQEGTCDEVADCLENAGGFFRATTS
jgi:hypothetical protein